MRIMLTKAERTVDGSYAVVKYVKVAFCDTAAPLPERKTLDSRTG